MLNWVVGVIFLLCWIVNLKCFNTWCDNQPFISFPPPLPGNIAECVCVFALWFVLKKRHSHGGECNQCLASAGRCQAEQASWAQALDTARDRENVCVSVCEGVVQLNFHFINNPVTSVRETDGRELVDQCHSPSSMPKSQHKHTINCFLSYPCSVLSSQGRAINTAYVTSLKVLSNEL